MNYIICKSKLYEIISTLKYSQNCSKKKKL